MTSLLDANILIDAGKVGVIPKLVAASGQAPWRLTREVYDELTSGQGRVLLEPFVRPSPGMGTSEAQMSASIIAGGSWRSLGVGEASSIAAAITDESLEFVTWDRQASWRGLHELRGRTVVGHTWLGRLVQLGLLDKVEADAMARADTTRRHPAWWGGPG